MALHRRDTLLGMYLLLITFSLISTLKEGNAYNWPFSINFILITILTVHTSLLISIQHKNYPDKEISKTIKLWLNITAILAWISVSFLIIGIAGLTYQITAYEASYSSSNYSILIPVLAGLFLLAIGMIFQLAGGRRLRKTIDRNARQLLEDSFM